MQLTELHDVELSRLNVIIAVPGCDVTVMLSRSYPRFYSSMIINKKLFEKQKFSDLLIQTH